MIKKRVHAGRRSMSFEFERLSDNQENRHSNLQSDEDVQSVSSQDQQQSSSTTYFNSSSIKGDDDLDSYIYRTQLSLIQNNYSGSVKKAIGVMFLLSVVLIIIYHVTGQTETESGRYF